MEYVTYNSWLPEHTLCAVGILQVVTTSPSIHKHLVGLFTSTPSISVLIRHGFVECLDSEQDDPMLRRHRVVLFLETGEATLECGQYPSSRPSPLPPTHTSLFTFTVLYSVSEGRTSQADEEDEDGFGIHCHIKEAILKFLQQSVSHSAPNVAHYLLGFDTKKDIKKMVFQQPGVQEFPRTCLHSIINMLDNSIGARSGDLRHSFKPRVIEKAYRMLYSLSADTRTYEPVLRFLRSCNDFLVRHLACLPFSGTNRGSCVACFTLLPDEFRLNET
uniref:Uncharacterized protein n=1 Tax=Timema douglasi TaxID=61478 RepID=A0A7R8VRV1_TIMDO|nr:unnamed protein product [Timema douglasi]